MLLLLRYYKQIYKLETLGQCIPPSRHVCRRPVT